MKIALCSDELYPINDFVAGELVLRNHQVVLFGALKSRKEEPWPKVAEEAAQSIIRGDCREGIFFCFTGTGIAMAANKVAGIRAALCGDAETARLARVWNHANVLALSNRLTTNDLAKEILDAWFAAGCDPRGNKEVQLLSAIENRTRQQS